MKALVATVALLACAPLPVASDVTAPCTLVGLRLIGPGGGPREKPTYGTTPVRHFCEFWVETEDGWLMVAPRGSNEDWVGCDVALGTAGEVRYLAWKTNEHVVLSVRFEGE